MKDIKVSDTHNYAIVGHAHDGKTSLGEAILHTTGATQALGSVAAGTAVCAAMMGHSAGRRWRR